MISREQLAGSRLSIAGGPQHDARRSSVENLMEQPFKDKQPVESEQDGPLEIAMVGDLTDNASDLHERLLAVPAGGECTLYFDSPGGSPYCATSLMNLILLRKLQATGIVTGECSSAALWPLAACQTRIVTPYSVLLFHHMRWQSEEHVQLNEATEWARHFAQLERQMDHLLAQLFDVPPARLEQWVQEGRYVTGSEFAEAGLGKLLDPSELLRTRLPSALATL